MLDYGLFGNELRSGRDLIYTASILLILCLKRRLGRIRAASIWDRELNMGNNVLNTLMFKNGKSVSVEGLHRAINAVAYKRTTSFPNKILITPL